MNHFAAAVMTMVVIFGSAAGLSGQQKPPAKPLPDGLQASAEELSLVNAGWTALAARDFGKASAAVASVMAKNPRSIAAASLWIEIEASRGGGLAALQVYEQWLNSRKLEDGYLLRRCAKALLWEGAAVPEVEADALQYLSADDDPFARARLANAMLGGGLAETRALARLGDEGAVNRLIAMMAKYGASNKTVFIEALVQSRSPRAIPVLTTLLDDKDPSNVSAAADGLGTLNATSAIPKLQRLHADSTALFPVQFLTAGALYKMNDLTGLPLLQRQLTSEIATLRVGAAELMASRPDAAWMQVVRALVTDPDPGVRLRAAKLIAPFELDLARQTLEPLLVDSNPAIRQLAGVAITDRTATDFATLRRLLRSAELSTRMRAAGRILELTR